MFWGYPIVYAITPKIQAISLNNETEFRFDFIMSKVMICIKKRTHRCSWFISERKVNYGENNRGFIGNP